jgi:hypothetical protein
VAQSCLVAFILSVLPCRAEEDELGPVTSKIKIGMEQLEVIAVLASKGITPTVTDNSIAWEEKGSAHIRDATQNHSQLKYERWNA